MKLNIGQNIRNLRRAADMTQEELAAKLGVTYQSVSRWENGGTYPDMELLPAIADVFGVTIDHLLDRDRKDVKKELQSLGEQLETAVRERENDKVTDILCTIRRDLSRFADDRFSVEIQEIVLSLEKYTNEAPPAVLEEFRQFLDALEKHLPGNKGIAVRTMAVLEDDEHLDKFLDKYSSHMNLSVDSLLRYRYRRRGETENFAYMNQMHIHSTLCEIFRRAGSWNRQYQQDGAWMSGPCLRFLHELHGLSPDTARPVSGDGSLDLWAEERIGLGFRYAAYLVTQNRPDDALDVLEDTAELLEKFMNLPLGKLYHPIPPTVLKSTSPLLKDFTRTAFAGYFSDPGDSELLRRGVNISHGKKVSWGSQIYPPVYLECLNGWNEFDPVRESPRFQAVRSRLEQFAEPVSKEQEERESEEQRAYLKEKGIL